MYADRRHLDTKMYDHFQSKWIELESTQSWLQRREFAQKVKGVLTGVVVSLLMGLMTLVIILGLWGGK